MHASLQKQVGCFIHGVVTMVAANWTDSGYERFAFGINHTKDSCHT